jgi:hypothetical protein
VAALSKAVEAAEAEACVLTPLVFPDFSRSHVTSTGDALAIGDRPNRSFALDGGAVSAQRSSS